MLGSVTAQITLEAGGLTGLHVVEDLGWAGGSIVLMVQSVPTHILSSN